MVNLCDLGHSRKYWHKYHVCFEIGCRGKGLNLEEKEYLETLLSDFNSDFFSRNYHIVEFQIHDEHVHMIIDITPQLDLYTIIIECGNKIEKQFREKFPSALLPQQRLWSRLMSSRTMAIEPKITLK